MNNMGCVLNGKYTSMWLYPSSNQIMFHCQKGKYEVSKPTLYTSIDSAAADDLMRCPDSTWIMLSRNSFFICTKVGQWPAGSQTLHNKYGNSNYNNKSCLFFSRYLCTSTSSTQHWCLIRFKNAHSNWLIWDRVYMGHIRAILALFSQQEEELAVKPLSLQLLLLEDTCPSSWWEAAQVVPCKYFDATSKDAMKMRCAVSN